MFTVANPSLGGKNSGVRSQRLGFCLFTFCILHSAFLPACPPDWINPPHYFGYASETGSFHYWRDIATVDFGNGLKIPLRFDFDSSREDPSPYLGAFWRCTLLEAGVVQKTPAILVVTLLGGQKLYLVQDKTPSLSRPGGDPIHSSPSTLKYASQDGHWRAERKGTMLEVVRDCGWAMKYHLARSSMIKGQIASLTTDQGRTLVWDYKGDLPVAIHEAGKNPVLEVQSPSLSRPGGDTTHHPPSTTHHSQSTLLVNGWKYALAFAAVEGEPGETSLQSLTWPDGTKEEYRLKPASLAIATPDSGERTFTWNAATGRIFSDCDGWKYRVGALKSDWERPSVSRTNKAGKSESYHFDAVAGRSTFKNSAGVITTEHFITTPGVNFMTIKKVDQKENGITKTSFEHFFNEKGRLIRERDYRNGRNVVTEFLYNRLGDMITIPEHATVIWTKKGGNADDNSFEVVKAGKVLHSITYDQNGKKLEELTGYLEARFNYQSNGKLQSMDLRRLNNSTSSIKETD